MVQHYEDENYSFHLDHFNLSSSSNTTTLSSIHKQRIDTLFQSKRQIQRGRQPGPSNVSSRSSRRASVSPVSKSRSNAILREGRPAHLRHSSSVTVNTNNNDTNDDASIRRTGAQTVSSKVAVNQAPATVIRIGPDSRPLPPKPNKDSSGTRASIPPTSGVRVKSIPSNINAQEELEKAFGGKDQQQKSFLDTRSAVQAQIERLFADASKENITKNQKQQSIPPPPLPPHTSKPAPDAPPPPPPLETHPALRNTPSPKFPTSTIKRNTPSPHSSGTVSACSTISRASSSQSSSQGSTSTNSNMVYRVDYLGAVQLTGKATSLEVLQDPLKQLYYIHKFGISKGRRVPLSTLSITDSGLRILRNAPEKDAIDFTNSFSTIAVWAAIKMVIKKKTGNNGLVSYCYAFLPLICDPEAQEKFNTYYPLDVADPSIMDGPHPPMFACVMRKTGESRILECHGFICRSSEDAIVVAANLYQALLGTMNSDSSSPVEELEDITSDSEATPTRPPRRRRSPPQSNQGSLRRASSEDILRPAGNQDSFVARFKRSANNLNEIAIAEDREQIPNNKLVIPRSKSFANVSQALDAHNLFGDPKTKIGLGRIDDVLKAVINPNGMSYSEMDPQHRELLMKMAVILTKDEIYQRSKNIMRSQRPRSNSILGGFESDSDASTITSVIKATKRSISRFSSRASNSLRPSYFRERMPLKKFNTHQGPISLSKEPDEPKLKALNYGYLSDGSLSRRTPKTPMPRRSPAGRSYAIYSECEYDSECSSKCYCTLPVKNGNSHNCGGNTNKFSTVNNKKKQAPCDCDSESCAESERCYCSLKRIKKNGLRMYEINLDSETDTTATNGTLKRDMARQMNTLSPKSTRSSDEIRTNSWKTTAHRNTSIRSPPQTTDRSKSRLSNSSAQNGPITRPRSMSTSSSLRSDCLSVASRSSAPQSRQVVRPRSRSHSTDSILEETRSNRRYRHQSGSLGSANSESSSRSSPGLDSQNSDDSNSSQTKILLLSAADPSGKVVYRGASQRRQRPSSDTASIMSMKKTAEIAALFSELKLSQKTDLIERLQEQIFLYG
ncbi:PH domain-like [Trinorchestia longiramus]|nr:PH domain-like [Trinorchestia longiramus]